MNDLSAYRPIVLLDVMGKVFERIIADCDVQHLNTVDAKLSENQFWVQERSIDRGRDHDPV